MSAMISSASDISAMLPAVHLTNVAQYGSVHHIELIAQHDPGDKTNLADASDIIARVYYGDPNLPAVAVVNFHVKVS